MKQDAKSTGDAQKGLLTVFILNGSIGNLLQRVALQKKSYFLVSRSANFCVL
jgi:hypothetical protein